MKLTTAREGKRLTITINGTIDAKTAPDLEAELTEEALDGVEELYFDMKDMDYTSSVGLRAILNAYQILDEREGRMVLQHINDDVREIFELTGFMDFLEVED